MTEVSARILVILMNRNKTIKYCIRYLLHSHRSKLSHTHAYTRVIVVSCAQFVCVLFMINIRKQAIIKLQSSVQVHYPQNDKCEQRCRPPETGHKFITDLYL